MRFDWDKNKDEANILKHGISFEVAITAFDDPYALIAPDPKHSKSEVREWLIGESDFGVLVIVFTKRVEKIIRIISARQASKKERVLYEEYKRISV